MHPIIGAIELTNVCNLRCYHCPVGRPPKQHGDGVDYPKGFLTIENFLKALKHCKPNVELSAHGEALLHPNVFAFVEIAKKFGKDTFFHTNGLLLTDEACEKLVQAKINAIQVSLHTEKSLENFKRLYDINEKAGTPVKMFGEFLTCEYLHIRKWVASCKLEDKHLAHITIGPTHNWALNAPAENDYMQKCRYILGNECVMKWDGTIVSCCFDFEAINTLGHIDNFVNLSHKADYKLCKTCSPAWVNQNNAVFWPLHKERDY